MSERNDAIVKMADQLASLVKQYESFNFPSTSQETGHNATPLPLSLNLMLSNDCETSCVYCYARRRRTLDSPGLPTERWIEIFRQARTAGIQRVTLCGGDPLLRKDAIPLLAELVRLEMQFNLSTRRQVTSALAQRLKEIGMTAPVRQRIREIQVSLDGPDSAMADHLAGSNGYFYRAIDSIRNLVPRGFNLRVKTVVTPYNSHRVYPLIKLAADMGVKQFSISACSSARYRQDDPLFLSQNERVALFEQCGRARANYPDVEIRLNGLLSEPEAKILHALEAQAQAVDREGHVVDLKGPLERAAARGVMTITPDGKMVLFDSLPEEGDVVGDVSSTFTPPTVCPLAPEEGADEPK